MKTRCTKCRRLAEFVSPDNLCRHHWAEWWVDGLVSKTDPRRKQLMKETLEDIDGTTKRTKG